MAPVEVSRTGTGTLTLVRKAPQDGNQRARLVKGWLNEFTYH